VCLYSGQNVRKQSLSDTASHPWRPESSAAPLWEHWIWWTITKQHDVCFLWMKFSVVLICIVVIYYLVPFSKRRSILLFTAQCMKQYVLQWKPVRICVFTALCVWYLICLFTRISLWAKIVWIYFGRRFFSFFLKVPHCQYRDSAKSQFTFTYQENLVKVCVFCSL
jgi:hypothetical protein